MGRRFTLPMMLLALAAPLALALAGCGTLFSDAPDEDAILDGPIAGLSRTQLETFFAGDDRFSERFTAATGLGPVFNERSCASCHPGDGRGHPSTNLTRFGRGDPDDPPRFDNLLALGGPQLQDRAVPGYVPEVLPREATGISVRGGPIVVGLGLIEAIPDTAILANADPDDRDGDGISGRANYVAVPEFFTPLYDHHEIIGGKALGRFGRKATAITLFDQTVGAYHADMGLTTDAISRDVYNPLVGGPSGDAAPDPEVSSDVVASVVFYLRTLRPPEQQNSGDAEVQRGATLFTQVGCAKCHVPELRSGSSPIAALSDKPVRLYSDLLLHDMGPALADNYPEGDANGREWRTTPLWGLGRVPNVLGGQAFYLHDGRARTLVEAIEAHGGEAESAKRAAFALGADDREALLSFLRSL
ncbi:MAG: thiol oxidoreductase [Myxococcales bacterium]|nr:thiol oxidoreductase [Myxococcales bacterium]